MLSAKSEAFRTPSDVFVGADLFRPLYMNLIGLRSRTSRSVHDFVGQLQPPGSPAEPAVVRLLPVVGRRASTPPALA
ncbi:hypothetical protein EVAR_88126_1 [Eumeta japonica]|uniref:Uncharacterized protein n=1 Tax=Eumeta variegata TaxID=151549 RepID=A0A4C1WRQ8_EUMVA|nr:hypothetical protein EVAR_88126_1 [Eumeta japonica]